MANGLTLQEAQNRALKLMDEWSLNGVREDGSLTADYTLKFNALADQAQQEISDRVGIYATYVIDQTTVPDIVTSNGLNKYLLPSNYKNHRYVRIDDGDIFAGYRIEDGYFVVPQNLNSTFTLHYFRYPTTIDDNTPPTYVFEIDAYMHYLIPYFMGGMVLSSASEDTQLSSKLLNMYYTKLNSATKREIRYPRTTRQVMRW